MAQTVIRGSQIKDLTVDTADLADGAVDGTKLAVNSVTTNKIVDFSVSSGKLAGNSVTNPKIQDGAVTTSKIADSNVTEAKLTNNYPELDNTETISGQWTFSNNLQGTSNPFYLYNTTHGATVGIRGESAGGTIRTVALNPDTPAFLPATDNVYDLGASTESWKDLYVQGNIYVGSGSNDYIAFNETTNIWSIYSDGTEMFEFDDADLLPPTDAGSGTPLYSRLGSSSRRWQDVFSVNYYVWDAIFWGGSLNDKITFDGTSYNFYDGGTHIAEVKGSYPRRVSMTLFPDGNNSTADNTGPQWTELATPGGAPIRWHDNADGDGFLRTYCQVPQDYKSGTSITLYIRASVRTSANAADYDYVTIQRYIDVRGPGDTSGGQGAGWNVLSGSNTSVYLGYNQIVDDTSLYTISSGSLAAGDMISAALKISSIDSGNKIYIHDVFIEYTAELK